MRLRHYIAFIPLLLFVTIEVHQTVLWYTLQFQKQQRTGYYKPKKEDLQSLKIRHIDQVHWTSKDEIKLDKGYFKVLYMDRDRTGFTLYLEKDDHSKELKEQLERQKKKEKEEKIRSLKKPLLTFQQGIEFEFQVTEIQKKDNFSKLLQFYRSDLANSSPPPEVCA
ncbi:MAG: hypothetical protein KDC84_14935 [Crocinitomicaceae bacterium]|nr:hypothetical protein [Crocinitomicaceae bacterium]